MQVIRVIRLIRIVKLYKIYAQNRHRLEVRNMRHNLASGAAPSQKAAQPHAGAPSGSANAQLCKCPDLQVPS